MSDKLRERFERLGFIIAPRAFMDSRHYATDASGQKGSVDMVAGKWHRWGDARCWTSIDSLERASVPVDPEQARLDRLCGDIRRRYPEVAIDAAGRFVTDGGPEVICTDTRTGTQFLARTLADVIKQCGDPPPISQQLLFSGTKE